MSGLLRSQTTGSQYFRRGTPPGAPHRRQRRQRRPRRLATARKALLGPESLHPPRLAGLQTPRSLRVQTPREPVPALQRPITANKSDNTGEILTFSVAMWPAATLPVALVSASRRNSSGVPRRTQPSMNLGPTAKAGRGASARWETRQPPASRPNGDLRGRRRPERCLTRRHDPAASRPSR
jgi:hypothetical protein